MGERWKCVASGAKLQIFFFFIFFIFKLYNIVLAPPNIEMNPPHVFKQQQLGLDMGQLTGSDIGVQTLVQRSTRLYTVTRLI